MHALGERDRDELNQLYREERPLVPPSGVFDGRLLCWLDSPPVRHPVWRPLSVAMFQLSPFGVDFGRRCWFFGLPSFRLGRFDLVAGPSRFRETATFGMHYESSSLPPPVKDRLYDEVKPLDESTCLGVGGLVVDGRAHALFFFALERRS